MKKKYKFIIITSFFVVLCFFGFQFFYSNKETFEPKIITYQFENYDGKKYLSKIQIGQDRDQLINLVENIHPFFELEKDLENYESAKKEFIEICSSGMYVDQFIFYCSKYLSCINDCHTNMNFNQNKFFDVDFEYRNGKVYLKEMKSPVKSVDGLEIVNLLQLIENYYPFENNISKKLNYEKYLCDYDFLYFVDKSISSNNLNVILENGEEYNFSKISYFNSKKESSINVVDDFIIISLVSCVWDENYQKICNELEKYLNNGLYKVIIDVRGNVGGDSSVCTNLLHLLGMKESEYSVYIRYSKEAKNQNGYSKETGNDYFRGKKRNGRNKNIKLCVLTDYYTFSSATMLAVYVRDGKLGLIIGEPSSNKPNCYGDIIYFTLNNSKLSGTISHKKFIRPDDTNLEDTLYPDEIIKSDYAMDKAFLLM